MVKINIVRDKEGFIWEFTVKGHAGFNKKGSDIVCAGISAITYTAVGALKELVGYSSYTENNGFMKCVVSTEIPEELKFKAKTILETIIIGYKQIENSYKKYVSIYEEEV